MQIKFRLSKNTTATFQPDGRYEVHNASGSVLLTVAELEQLKKVDDLAEASKHDMEGFIE